MIKHSAPVRGTKGRNTPFIFTTPILFHDVDPAGTAYYPRLVDFCHCAFESFFNECIGPAYSKVIRGGVGFPAVRFEVDFVSPIRHGDIIEISVRVIHLGRTSVGLAYEARRGRTVLFRAKNVVVVVDLKTMTKRPLSPRMRQNFLAAL
ncbi:MAG: acyl-CoA thioesterase [Vicinamibacteria bacterium]